MRLSRLTIDVGRHGNVTASLTTLARNAAPNEAPFLTQGIALDQAGNTLGDANAPPYLDGKTYLPKGHDSLALKQYSKGTQLHYRGGKRRIHIVLEYTQPLGLQSAGILDTSGNTFLGTRSRVEIRDKIPLDPETRSELRINNTIRQAF